MRRRLFSIILLPTLLLVGVAVSTPASAQTTPTIDVISATLVANGAAVDVELTVTCPQGYSGQVSALVTQRSGNSTAQGGAGTPITCTGQSQTAAVRATSRNGNRFKKGTAVVTASVGVCGPVCDVPEGTTSETVRVR